MYGKFFASTFTGSMFGAGTDVFALWGYVIATAIEGTVEINPPFVAAVLGSTPERIVAALAVLCDPDAASRSEAEDGRRMVHEGAYQYRVVNHAHYRAIRNEEDRRAYNRDAKRRERERKSVVVKPEVNDSQACQPIQKQSQKQKKEEIHAHVSGSADETPEATPADAVWEMWREEVEAALSDRIPLTPRAKDFDYCLQVKNKDRSAEWVRLVMRCFLVTKHKDIAAKPRTLGFLVHWWSWCEHELAKAGYGPDRASA